jgi:acyl carrier protein
MKGYPSTAEQPEPPASPQGGGPGQRLFEMVADMLAKNAVTRPFSVHDQLSEAGLTSLDMVNLMLAVEAEFDLTIPSSEITPANFRSITSIEALIVRIRARTASL